MVLRALSECFMHSIIICGAIAIIYENADFAKKKNRNTGRPLGGNYKNQRGRSTSLKYYGFPAKI